MILQIGGLFCFAALVCIAIAASLFVEPEQTQDTFGFDESSRTKSQWPLLICSAVLFLIGVVLCFTGAVLWIIKVA